MFTGIVATTGRITALQPLEQGLRLTIAAPGLKLSDVALGDSIAHNGVCLTVIAKGEAPPRRRGSAASSPHGAKKSLGQPGELPDGAYQVDVSKETLDCTVGLDILHGELNLEKAMRLSDFIGGHLVSGHVDGVGKVVKFEPVGESHELVIKAPRKLAKYIARKGSVTVDGVSLTTNRVKGREFSINLIPHTVEVTTLKRLSAGARVNLEVDLIARYVERMLQP
ncbi:MAG: riboflavin synthase [Rhodocyclaceae bacterium]|jgi:riboflavin synthase|nr:riboflavin synthase [Rhodocyclaceae bacterium]